MVPASSTLSPTIHQLADTRVLRRMPVEFRPHLHMLKPDARERRKDINEESSRGGVGVARWRDGVAGRVGFLLLKRGDGGGERLWDGRVGRVANGAGYLRADGRLLAQPTWRRADGRLHKQRVQVRRLDDPGRAPRVEQLDLDQE